MATQKQPKTGLAIFAGIVGLLVAKFFWGAFRHVFK